MVDVVVKRMLAAQGMAAPSASNTISETSQCHDITVYPALGLAGGACEGHGLLLDVASLGPGGEGAGDEGKDEDEADLVELKPTPAAVAVKEAA